MEKKRHNYTGEEKQLLFTLVEKYKNIVECRVTNGVSNKEKDAAWSEICSLFNSKGLNVQRDTDSLRKQWSNFKQDKRKVAAAERRELYKTGGGPPAKAVTNNSLDLVLSVISPKTVTGLENPYDSDFIEVVATEAQDLIAASTSTKTVELEVEQPPAATPKWTGKRRPKLQEPSNRVDEEKIKVLRLQAEVLQTELNYKKELFAIELEHKKKMFKIEEQSAICSCKK